MSSGKANITARAGRWSAAHPWRAIGVWVLFLVVAVVAGSAVGTVKLKDSDNAVGESGRAQQAVSAHFESHASEQVLVRSTTLTAADPQFRAGIADVVHRITATGQAIDMQSPLNPTYANQITADGHSALVQFDLTGDRDTAADRVAPVLAAVDAAAKAHPQVSIAEAGDASIAKAINDTTGKDFKNAEKLSLPITLLVLLVAFGALVAAVLPLVLALTAVATASGLMAFTSHLSGVDGSASSVMLLIGLAVGVDYSLFYVKREREERTAGRGKEAALAAAAATSGRAVLISGITVLIAMSGMFLTGSKIFIGMAEATMLVVAVAVVGSLTVLPALLAKIGDRIERGRIPLLGRLRHADRDSRAWNAILTPVLRRPAIAAALAAAFLVVLALPAARMHTATPGASDIPHDTPTMQTYDRIQQAFPGGGAPAVLAVTAPDVTAPAVQDGIAKLTRAALASGEMNQPISVRTSDDHKAALVMIPLAGNGEDAASAKALATLRDDVIPATIDTVPGVQANVSGMTAGTEDFNALMHTRQPIVFGFVLLLAFALLLASFRSLVIAVKAVLLNLLSVAASYGVLVAVFQWGWGESVLGFTSTHSITSWLPLFLFVILFGLSMDYHVFIISRIRELYDRGETTGTAVAEGIKSTAGVVTAAAVVMVFVFATFGTLSQVSMKSLGVGLAVAVLLDATVVRGVLLPATMKLLGDWNWYLPRWLDWLPRISHGADVDSGRPVHLPEQRTEQVPADAH